MNYFNFEMHNLVWQDELNSYTGNRFGFEVSWSLQMMHDLCKDSTQQGGQLERMDWVVMARHCPLLRVSRQAAARGEPGRLTGRLPGAHISRKRDGDCTGTTAQPSGPATPFHVLK